MNNIRPRRCPTCYGWLLRSNQVICKYCRNAGPMPEFEDVYTHLIRGGIK